MDVRSSPMRNRLSAARVVAAAVGGLFAATVTGSTRGWSYAPVAGWIVAAVVFLVWTWSVIVGMNPAQTAGHATHEDPSRFVSDVTLVGASIASLGGVAYLLVDHSSGGKGETAITSALGLTSVAASWLTVHTLYTLRYALLYYGDPVGGIEFNQDEPPAYLDFAYLAFSVGMTYQVSDTDLQTPAIRRTVLRHALLSFLLGAIVLATTINLVAGLGG